MNDFALKGNILHTAKMGELEIFPDAYLICADGICQGVFYEPPGQYAGIPVTDYSGLLIIPGMTDLHIHAPQFACRGTGMNAELLDWLNTRVFPEEIRFADMDYAARAYQIFADQMRKSATTRAVIFGTTHRNATLLLADLMEASGLVSYIGKVNMDRNAPEDLLESSADAAASDTRAFIRDVINKRYARTKPILTPRFIPCCGDALLFQLSKIRQEFDLPVQSHLSENPAEVELVKTLEPDAEFYGDCYDKYGLFGGESGTIMAHCVYSSDAEIRRMKENGVRIAHCPNSNTNLSSGIAPIRKYIHLGLRVGLGSDVAGGQTESMFRAIADAVQASKIYWRYINHHDKPLTFAESFYLATKGGGSFFGNVGSFETGYEFDALVIDDSKLPCPRPLSLADRLERAVYLGLDQTSITAKYARGLKIL